MKLDAESTADAVTLRVRALAHLGVSGTPGAARGATSDALGVLFRLASSPATASSALALLHELQVLQVEVDMQDEDLRRSRLDLEARLRRQQELYDCCPVAYLTLDPEATILGLNRHATVLLAAHGPGAVGRRLQACLTPAGAAQLEGLLARLRAGAAADLELAGDGTEGRQVHASARPDPAGPGFLLVLMEAGAAAPQH